MSLSGRTTRIKFDDYISDPMPLDNGTTQGDPSSMLYYSFYNAPLIEIASSNDELSPGFVDDTMILAIGDSIGQCHLKLKDMMERPGGGFEWSYTHNSPFELSKTALMNFPRTHRDHIPAGLTLDKPNEDGSVTSSVTLPVLSYSESSSIPNYVGHSNMPRPSRRRHSGQPSSGGSRNQQVASPRWGQNSSTTLSQSQGSPTGLRYGTRTFTSREQPVRPGAQLRSLTSSDPSRERL